MAFKLQSGLASTNTEHDVLIVWNLKNETMIVSILLIAAGIIALFFIMRARSKNKDSNGPMPGR